MINKNNTKSFLLAFLAVLFWSTVATAFKIALKYVDFSQLLFYSALTSVLVLSFIFFDKNNRQIILSQPAKSWLKSAFLGLLNPFLYYLVLFKAYSLLPAQMAQPLNYTWPLVLSLLAVPFLGHKMTWIDFFAISISFLGVWVISTKGNIFSFNFENPLGITLAVGSSIIWASYWILNTKDNLNPSIRLFMNFLFGTFYALIFVLIFSTLEIKNAIAFIPMIYVGLFEMGITFLLWSMALKLTDKTAKISNLVYLSPFLSLIFINFFLKEKILVSTIIGLVLIVGGILFQQFQKRKKDEVF